MEQMRLLEKNRIDIIKRVETEVIKAARIVFNKRISIVKECRKPPFPDAVSRCVACKILHDDYCVKYKYISEYIGMEERSIMKCVAKAREYVFTDEVYSKLYNITKSNL